MVLYEDSTLAWFKEKGRGQPEGSLKVKDAPEMMAVSQWTARIPGRPDLPTGCHVVQLMAFGTRRQDKVHWLLAQSEQEVTDWMTAISNTLPPPPLSPDEKTVPRTFDSMAARLPPVGFYPTIPGEVPPPYAHQPLGQVNGMYQASPASGANTTIVVRDRSAGDFTTGLMMGAALTNWGHGCGWGSGGSGGGNGGYVHNHYETVISNDYSDLCFGDGDYGMDCGGDFGF